jgi:hypothetical protein
MTPARPTALPLPPVAATLAFAVPLWCATLFVGDLEPALLTLFGAALFSGAAWRLLSRLDPVQPARAVALIFLLLLPCQSDMIGLAACVMALAAAIDRRHGAMLAWYGVAVGLDPQALLLAPFFLALAINRRLPVRHWPVAPLMAGATMLAMSVVSGVSPIPDGLGRFPALSLGAPNIWSIVQPLPLGLPLLGLALAATIGAGGAYVARFSIEPLHGRTLIPAALLASLVTAGLVPGLHDDAFVLSAALALILAFIRRDRAAWTVAILVQAGSMLALFSHARGIDALAAIGAVATVFATISVARAVLEPAANDNPLMIRTLRRSALLETEQPC